MEPPLQQPPPAVPPGVIISVVVCLLVLAAICLVFAIWTILNDLWAARSAPTSGPAPIQVVQVPPAGRRPTVHVGLVDTRTLLSPAFARRGIVPPGVPILPLQLSRGMIHGTPMPAGRDEEDEEDYTEVEDGVTMIRDLRVAARR